MAAAPLRGGLLKALNAGENLGSAATTATPVGASSAQYANIAVECLPSAAGQSGMPVGMALHTPNENLMPDCGLV